MVVKETFWFGKKDDFLIHGDEKTRVKYFERVKKIKSKDDEYTYKLPRYANFWNVNFLWLKGLKTRKY